MKYPTITIENCVFLCDVQNLSTVINDGQVIGFEKKEILAGADNQSED